MADMYGRWGLGGCRASPFIYLASLVPLQSWSQNIDESPNVAISPVENGFSLFLCKETKIQTAVYAT